MPVGTAIYEGTFRTADVTAPTISAISSGTPGSTTATITWTTNELSDSEVQWDTDAGVPYANTSGVNTTPVTSHSVPLTGLPAGTLINFRVMSRDPSGNLQVSANQTFTTAAAADTTPPVITNISVAEWALATLRANCGGFLRIEWDTDELADSQVEVATNSAFIGSILTTLADSGTKVLHHTHYVPNLLPDTTYFLRPISKDAAANVATGATQVFTTKWTPAALPVGVRPHIWYSWRIAPLADRYIGAGLNVIADAAAIGAAGTIYNFGTLGDIFSQPTAAQRPTFSLTGVGGGPGAVHDGSNDNVITIAHPTELEYTGDRWILVVINYPAGNTTTFRRIIGAYDSAAGNAERWAVAMNAPTAGKFGIFGDTKGSYQGSTAATLNDGLNNWFLANRGGTDEDLWINGTLADSFTGMANTANTGNVRVFSNGNASAVTPGAWIEIIAGPGKLTVDQVAQLTGYLEEA